MGTRTVLLASAVALLFAVAAEARAADRTLTLQLKPDILANVLRELAGQSKIDILFSPGSVKGRFSAGVTGKMNIERALHSLLDDAGLAFRRTDDDTVVIYSALTNSQPPAVPEILVLGLKTQNEDMKRTEDDIQMYQIVSARDIAKSHSDDVGQLLRTWLTNNATGLAPSQDLRSNRGSNRSEANLQGLGANQTLVLVDGGRMPSIPSQNQDLSLSQPDLNGVPLFAIDRVESLTGTSGGIYGPGAIGGMINIVLKRDYRGADLAVTRGLTDQGDAVRQRVDARIGFTPDHGRTDFMLSFSRSVSAALPAGDRGYSLRALDMKQADDPYEPAVDGGLRTIPLNGIVIAGGSRQLSLKPALGGQDLGYGYTFLPSGYGGIASDQGQVLLRNGGQLPRLLSPDGSGARQSLTNGADTTSLLINARHRFSDAVETFVDVIGYQNNGHSVSGAESLATVDRSAPDNPFDQDVAVTFPLQGFDTITRDHLRTWRLSTGALVQLPSDWKAEVQYSLGFVRETITSTGFQLNGDFPNAIAFGIGGASGEPILDPFGDSAAFLKALQAYKLPLAERITRRNRLTDGKLRLAGPVFATRAGPVSLSLLAESHREIVPATTINSTDAGGSANFYPRYSQSVSSLYGELRAPLVLRDAGPRALRGLELQFAVRYDDTKSIIPVSAGTSAGEQIGIHQDATAFTFGLRAFPQDHLMVRASIATGVLPPTPQQLLQRSGVVGGSNADPQRPGDTGGGRVITELSDGSPSLKPERARTIGIGIVWNPEGEGRPRISVDFTHIDKWNEISSAHEFDTAFFLANEPLYPDRVVRAALTAADLAAGYTGGIVTLIDTSAENIGRTKLDTVDLRADYNLAVGARDILHFYNAVTWEPRLTRRYAPGLSADHYVGFADGPLEWRAVARAELTHGAFSAGIGAQFYDDYDAIPARNILSELDQHVRKQFYVDLTTGYSFDLRENAVMHRLDLRLGMQNVLNRKAPVVINTGYGYSPYGDPRGRRFEATLAAHF